MPKANVKVRYVVFKIGNGDCHYVLVYDEQICEGVSNQIFYVEKTYNPDDNVVEIYKELREEVRRKGTGLGIAHIIGIY